MAYLINAKNYCKNNGYSEYKKGNYSNKHAVSNTITYVTRDSELLKRSKNKAYSWGGKGILTNEPSVAINCFNVVQNNADIQRRGGRRIIHHILSIRQTEAEGGFDEGAFLVNRLGTNVLIRIAMECCSYYYQNGFQVVYAIHHSEDGEHYHIHFIVNSINYVSGKKYIDSEDNLLEAQAHMRFLVRKYMEIAENINIAV